MTATEYTLTAPARPAFLSGVHDLLDTVWSETSRLTDADRARFESALIEIVGNIVVHSPVPAGASAVTMQLTIECRDDRVVADVRDDGGPLAEEVHLADAEMPGWEAESGRGLALARAMVDGLDYDRSASGNRWLITCLLAG